MENSTNLILQVAFLCPSKNIVAANNKYTSLTFFKSHEEFSFVKRYIIEIALLFFFRNFYLRKVSEKNEKIFTSTVNVIMIRVTS